MFRIDCVSADSKHRRGLVGLPAWWSLIALTAGVLASSASAQPVYEVVKHLESPIGGAVPRGGLVRFQGVEFPSNVGFLGTTADGGNFNKGTVYLVGSGGFITVIHHFTGGADGAHPHGTLVVVEGSIYGTTLGGGTAGAGTIFEIVESFAAPLEWDLYSKYHFSGGADGASPAAGLMRGVDGAFYGTTSGGGAGYGTVFRYNSVLNTIATLHQFGGTDGWAPYGELIQGQDGALYGTTQIGGAFDSGTIFKITAAGALTTLHAFAGAAGRPSGALTQAGDGSLYGITAHQHGSVYRLDSAGTFTTLFSFDGGTDGGSPFAGLTSAGGSLYGTTTQGGSGWGTVFAIDSAGALTTLHRFDGDDGGVPLGALLAQADGSFYGTTALGTAQASGGTVFTLSSSGVLTTVHRFFSGPDGARPYSSVIQASDGDFYGTSSAGGEFGRGTVFRLSASGTLTTLHSFTGGADGGAPWGSLVQADDGAFYGTTAEGGTFYGTVFKIDTAGVLTTLHTFTTEAGGRTPFGTLVQGTDGNLYGTTHVGGTGQSGTIFRISTTGMLTTLHSFAGARGRPWGALLQAADGSFYGTTSDQNGSVFRFIPGGSFTTLYTFAGLTNGGTPFSALIQGSDGHFYGTASRGGIGSGVGNGTIFRITAAGALTTLHRFDQATDGYAPSAPLWQTADGALYGTTFGGGAHGGGTVFKLESTGAFSVLHSFGAAGDGRAPWLSGLLEATNGDLYGTTAEGGLTGSGTIFRFTLNPNQAPIANGQSISTGEDAPVEIVLTGSDADNDPLTFTVVDAPANGTLSGTAPNLTYTPTPDYNGSDVFTFLTNDGSLESNLATVSITVTPANDAPLANSQSAITEEGTALDLVLTGSDVDGDALTFTIVTNPTRGTLSGTPPNVRYTPDVGAVGPDNFTFKVNDGTADSAAATVSLIVTVAPVAVNVTAPNGGERLFLNVPTTISWTAQGARLFDVAYSRNGGLSYAAIPGCTNLSGALRSCSWTPTASSSRALVRVTAWDYGDSSTVDTSDAEFVVSGATPTVTLTSPNTALNWAIGTVRDITWNHNLGASSRVRLELSRDSGANWEVLAAALPNSTANSGNFAWTVTGPVSTTARVRVSWADGPASDTSASAFVIAAPTVTVTSPTTTVNWTVDSTRTIRWTHNLGAAETMRIDHSADNGVTWTLVAANASNSSATAGSFVWVVPGPVSNQALIRVSRSADPAVQDVSDVPFNVTSRITVTAPNTAVTWGAGSTRTITWNHNYGAAQLFDVHASTDAGVTWAPLSLGVAAASTTTGVLSVRMPSIETTQALVRVSPSGVFGHGDISNVPFTLAAPTITVTNPSTNVRWLIGSTRTTSWTHNLGTAESVLIELSHDGGASWATLAASVANATNTSGSYTFVTPGPATITAQIRITWSANPAVNGTSATFRIQ